MGNLSNNDRKIKEDGKKLEQGRFRLAKENLAHASRFFLHFFVFVYYTRLCNVDFT